MSTHDWRSVPAHEAAHLLCAEELTKLQAKAVYLSDDGGSAHFKGSQEDWTPDARLILAVSGTVGSCLLARPQFDAIDAEAVAEELYADNSHDGRLLRHAIAAMDLPDKEAAYAVIEDTALRCAKVLHS